MSWIDFTGKTAVVTGAAAGIGRGIAVGLAEVGAAVVLIDRDETACRAAAAEIAAAGGAAHAVACDVTSAAEIARAVEQTRALAGPADILINNAGTQRPGTMETLAPEAWQAILSLNLTAYLLCAQAFGAAMLERGAGSIVHVASISARFPQGFSGGYSVTKAGVLMLSQQLATEWGPRGVRSNVVSPGLVQTPMTKSIYDAPGVLEARRSVVPWRRIGTPKDIADAVVFLASDRADYVTGEEIVVDGGFTRTIMSTIPRPGFEAASQ